MNGNRRDVLQLDVATRRHLDAELRQHVVEGLHRERRLRGLVTAAVEADHQAVANQLVGPYAADGGDVLQSLGLNRRCRQGHEHHHDERIEYFHRQHLLRTATTG